MLIDESRIVEIMHEHYQLIYLFCLSLLKKEADAKDVTQDVFKLLIEKSDKLDDSNIRSWLLEVASRKTKDKFREWKKRADILCFDDYTTEVPDFVEDLYFFDEIEVDEEDILQKKEEILNSLKPHERELYSYIYEDNMQYAKIAEKMGISEKAVNVRSFRLKQKIKNMVRAAFLTLILLILSL